MKMAESGLSIRRSDPDAILKKPSTILMECSSMFGVAAFGPGDPDSNTGWFALSNSNRKLSFHE